MVPPSYGLCVPALAFLRSSIRPHAGPIMCLWNANWLECSSWKTPSVVWSICTDFLQNFSFFFSPFSSANKHTLLSARWRACTPCASCTRARTHTHKHTQRDESQLGLRSTLTASVLSSPLSPSLPPALSAPRSQSWKGRLALNSVLWYGNVMVVGEGGVGDGRWIPLSAAVG